MWVVIYCQHGVWSVTAGFRTEKEANAHADMRLRGKGREHKEFVELRYIELPEGSKPPLPRRDYFL